MTLATPSKYSILQSLEGNMLGLDNSKAPAKSFGSGGGITNAKGDQAPYIMGRDLMGVRLFPIGQFGKMGSDYKECVRISHNDLFEDFLGAALPSSLNALHGSDASAAAAVHVAVGGTARLTTGAGSTHTMAVNGAQLTTPLVTKVSNDGLRFEARVGALSAATSQSICIGLVDVSTLSAPFTLATTTVTANGTNGAAFLQDAGGTNTGLNAVSVNAAGTPAVNALSSLSVGTTANQYDVYRIEIDSAGNAYFFFNNVLVATQLLAVATTAVLCGSVGIFSEATSASQTLDVDYMLLQQVRL